MMSAGQSGSTLAESPTTSRNAQSVFGKSGRRPSAGSDMHEMRRESEKQYHPLTGRAPGQETPNPIQKSISQRSYSDGYGYTTSQDREDQPKIEEIKGSAEKEWEVKWDGDHDPMNPRSMSTPRKWVIVLIVSASSLCVYVL